MKFRLSDWAEVAEIVASCAVVVSLVFVGLQIRTSTTAAQAASYQDLVALEIGMIQDLGKDPELVNLYYRAMLAPANLEPSERMQADYLRLATFRLWESFYHQYQSGALSPGAWRAREPIIHRHIRALFAGADGEGFLDELSSSFADYVRSYMATQE